MSLPHTYRFKVENQTGVTVESGQAQLFARRYKFDSLGRLTYETAESQVFQNAADIGDGAVEAGEIHVNASSEWIGGTFLFAARPLSGTAGNVNLFLERSTDQGSDFDTGILGTLLHTIPFSETNQVSLGRSFEL